MPRPRLFTPAQVREVRRIVTLRRSLPSVRELAKRLGTSDTHVCQIVNGKLYKDVR